MFYMVNYYAFRMDRFPITMRNILELENSLNTAQGKGCQVPTKITLAGIFREPAGDGFAGASMGNWPMSLSIASTNL
jgi:hypothetical protein